MTAPAPRAAVRALAVAFPDEVRTNQWFRDRFGAEVAAVEARRADALPGHRAGAPPAAARYLADPFRGTVQRFALAPGQRVLDVELDAARRALDAAGLAGGDIDLLISTSLPSDQPAVGQAAFLAQALGVAGAAWNLESTCSSSMVALQTACGLIAAGQYRRALIVSSCAYSRIIDGRSPLSWVAGDGAGALVVAASDGRDGLVGMHTVHTGETCGVFANHLVVEDGAAHIRMAADPRATTFLEDTLRYLPACCGAAAARAGVTLADVDGFVFNTPVAWFTDVACDALGVSPGRTVTAYPFCANVGPALMPTNLLLAAATGRIRRGDLVMLYGVGSVSTATATLLRWGDVALGAAPPGLLDVAPPAAPARAAPAGPG